MKTAILSTFASFLTIATLVAKGVDALTWHRHLNTPAITFESHRGLDGEIDLDWFIVSHISFDKAWCITAAEGTKDFGNLLLQPCDFEGAPLNQLWVPTEEGKIRSALDGDKCVAINHGQNVFPSARARLADCTNGLTHFLYENGHIKVESDDSFCLTNRGPNPHPTDFVHAKKCKDRADFFWEPIPHIPFYVKLSSGGGCAQPRVGSHRVFLDECDEDYDWRVQVLGEGEEIALLHSGLDDSMCLRAGIGSAAVDGTRMAVVPCDSDDELQQFSLGLFETTIHVGGDYDLCMVYRGTTPHVGIDPIIMKMCTNQQEPWEVSLRSDLLDILGI